jgi:hypothetical protein
MRSNPFSCPQREYELPTEGLILDVSGNSNLVRDKQNEEGDEVTIGRTEKVLRLFNSIKLRPCDWDR